MNIKQTYIPFLVFSFLLASIFTLVGAAPDASALSKAEQKTCYEKWAGAYTGKSGDGRKLSNDGLKNYEKSDCAKNNKGSCTLDRFEDGAAIRCKASNGEYDNGNKGWDGKKNSNDASDSSIGDGPIIKDGSKGATGTCGGVDTVLIKCADNGTTPESNAIWALLIMTINILLAGIGIVAVGGLVYAAILYATARDQAAQVTKAKETIFNIVLGLVLLALMWSFLQYLIPGGVFEV